MKLKVSHKKCFDYRICFQHQAVMTLSILNCSLISDPRRGCYIVLSTFIFFFFPPLLSGLYLWNRYSQRLQIECAAWSCGLILHCCLPSNSLSYFYFILFFFFPPRFCHNFVRAISLETLLAETPN